MTLSSDMLFSDFPPGCPHSPTRPPSTVSILGLAFRCNQPCRTPACQEALALCETPICLVHWDKPSPRELLEWKDEYKKAQLKRQGWAAASGHSLSAALLQTTFILMRCVWRPCLHTTQRSETDRCAGVSVKAGMSDIWTHPCFQTHIVSVPLIKQLVRYFVFDIWRFSSLGQNDVPPKARSISDSRLPNLCPSNLGGWDEWEEVMSCYGPLTLIQQELWPRCSVSGAWTTSVLTEIIADALEAMMTSKYDQLVIYCHHKAFILDTVADDQNMGLHQLFLQPTFEIMS